MRLVALLVTLLSAGSAVADQPSPLPPPTKVGAYLSMTGPSASFGISTQDGIELAIAEYNARSRSRKIELAVADTAGKAAEGGKAVTQLIDDGAIAVIGEVASSITLAGADVAQKRGIPMITPSSTNPKITEVGDMITRACMLDEDQAYALAMFAKKIGITKVAILSDQAQAYSSGLAMAFERDFKKAGGTIVGTQSYATADTDFKAQLQAIAATRPQAIFVPGYYMDAAAIAKQARALGIKTPFLGADGWDSEELGRLAGNALDGSYYVTHFAADDRRPAARAFAKAFEAKYKRKPDGLAALGYDATNVLLAAIDRANTSGRAKGADIAKAIRTTTSLAGVTGEITIDVYGQIGKPATIVKVTRGKPVYASTIAPR